MARHAPVLALVLLAPLAAQKWELPDAGAAVYRLERSVEVLDGGDKGMWRPGTRNQTVPVVLQGELDKRAEYLEGSPYYVDDLALWLAADLRKYGRAGKGRITVAQSSGVPPIEVAFVRKSAKRGEPQRIEATLRCEPVGERRWMLVRGEMVIERQLDREAGVLRWFTAVTDYDGVLRGKRTRYRVTDRYEFDRLESGSHATFRMAVARAIEKGVKEVRDDVGRDREWGPPGELALAVLTLLKMGVDRDSAEVQKGLEQMRKAIFPETYGLACAIMALEALYAPADERGMLLRGDIQEPPPREPSPEDARLLQQWTDQLLALSDSAEVDPAYIRRWGYRGRPRYYDNSNTQYALLGLYSAGLCGVEISRTVWFASLTHWLKDMRDVEAPGAVVDLLTHRDLKSPRRTRGRRFKVAPAAWGYNDPPLYGSMTAGAISSLAICDAMLNRGKNRLPPKVQRDLDVARDRAFRWFELNFSARANPGDEPHWRDQTPYFLYGYERACEFYQVARVGGRDWYFEGAHVLMARQRRSGSWDREYETCLALLFLKKAVYGPITGPRKR